MKTVMKKMFSLLLVAVMLVGVMPFAAFADTGVAINVTLNGEPYGTIFVPVPDGSAPLSSWMNSARAQLPAGAQGFATCSGFTGAQGEDITADMAFAEGWIIDAAFTSKYCTQCGTYDHYYEEGHCEHCGWGVGHATTCTRNCNLDYDCPSAYHKDDCKYNTCAVCGNAKHGSTPCCSECKELGGNHAQSCTFGCTGNAGCEWHFTHKAGCVSQHRCTVCEQQGHEESKCPTLFCTDCGYALANGVHGTGCIENCDKSRDCPNSTVSGGRHKTGCEGSLCHENGCTLNDGHTGEHTGAVCNYNGQCTKWLGHTGKHSYECQTAGCNLPINHSGKHSNESAYQNGSSKVKVYVNLYTSDVKTDTVHLYTYSDVSSNTPVYAFIAEQAEHLKSLLPAGYTWAGNVYDAENDDDAELMKGTVGNGVTVHINAYSAQDLVYIYVHNSRSMSNLRIIQLEGKKVGETITKKEVTKAVSKYYNVSSLSMYDEQSWEDYVDGASVQSVGSLEITSDPYFIDVRISGTSKTTSSGSGYTADSSNPKTGDTIFAPVAVMGLSVSALAVLLYLNKKRAF